MCCILVWAVRNISACFTFSRMALSFESPPNLGRTSRLQTPRLEPIIPLSRPLYNPSFTDLGRLTAELLGVASTKYLSITVSVRSFIGEEKGLST